MPDWKCEVVGGLGNHRRNRLLLQERKLILVSARKGHI